MPTLTYLPGTFPEPTGFLGEVDFLIQQLPRYALEVVEFVYPLFDAYWWLVFFTPIYILLRAIKTAWWLEAVVEKKDTYKFKIPSIGPADPTWKKVCVRVWMWLYQWW